MVVPRRNIARQMMVLPFSATSSLCDCVCIALDLEEETLELLNTPTSVRVNVEVEGTAVSNVSSCTLFAGLVDGSDDFAVDLAKNLGGENVCEFSSPFRPWIAFRSCAKAKGCILPSVA